MPNKWQVSALAAVIAISLLATTYFEPPTTWLDGLRVISAAVTAASIAVALFHFFLWRYLPKELVRKPNINGTWRVRAEPWSPDGVKLDPFDGYMFVRQYYFTMSMRQETETSHSELEAENFITTKGGLFELWAIYHCEPRATAKPQSIQSHYGSFYLRYSENELKGRFWIDGTLTDAQGRKVSGGEMRLYDRKKELLHDYEQAKAAYAANAGSA
jgi:hypothetical protein